MYSPIIFSVFFWIHLHQCVCIGAMEAGNLGAYLYQRTDEEVEEALKIIGSERFVKQYIFKRKYGFCY
jgi:hypothetical protein